MALTLKDIEENYRRSMVGSERAGNIRTFSRFQETGPYMRQLLGSENAVTSLPVDTPQGIGPRLSATGNAIAEGASILWDSEEASGRAYNPNTGRVDVIPSRTAMLQEAARTAEDMQRGVNAPGVAPVRAAQPTSPLAAINARAGIYQGGQPWSPGGELAGSPLAMEGPPTGSLGLPGFMEVPRKPTSIEHPAMATNAAGQMVYNPAGDFARYEGGTARGFFPGTTPAQHYDLAKKTFGSQFGSRETTGGSPAAQAARTHIAAQEHADAIRVQQNAANFNVAMVNAVTKAVIEAPTIEEKRNISEALPLTQLVIQQEFKDDPELMARLTKEGKYESYVAEKLLNIRHELKKARDEAANNNISMDSAIFLAKLAVSKGENPEAVDREATLIASTMKDSNGKIVSSADRKKMEDYLKWRGIDWKKTAASIGK